MDAVPLHGKLVKASLLRGGFGLGGEKQNASLLPGFLGQNFLDNRKPGIQSLLEARFFHLNDFNNKVPALYKLRVNVADLFYGSFRYFR